MTARAESAATTRERIVVTATSLLLAHAYEDVTLAEIAGAAGVSHQTVLNHFESKEGVALAVASVIGEETARRRNAAVPGDVAGAVRALVGDYERMGDANFRWAASSERLGRVAAVLDEARAGHQDWIVTMFGERLPESGPAHRRAVHALHAATDVYTWKLLRRDLHLSRSETERIIADLVVGIMEGAER